jgi:outer membrane protein OmpA-like peptidoglycan-associated protein
MQRHTLPLSAALLIAGCAAPTMQIHEVSAAKAPHPVSQASSMAPVAVKPLEESSFLYELLSPAALGISRVFDDGRRTYVLFDGAVPAGLMVFDENGKPLNFSEGAHAVLIDRVGRGVLLRTPTKLSFAQVRSPLPEGMDTAGVQTTENSRFLPTELAAARAELLRAETKLSETSAALDRAAAGDARVSLPSLKADLDEIQTTLDGLNATLVRTHFESGSALLALSDGVKEALIEAAREATQVRIRGRADATGLPETNLQLARDRALSVRRLLVEGGIEPKKLHTSFARADYIASNETAEGRAQNRRVDVVFVGGSPIHLSSLTQGSDHLESSNADNPH